MIKLTDEIADKMFKFLVNVEEIHNKKVEEILSIFFKKTNIKLIEENFRRITVVKCLQYNTENYFIDNEKLLLVAKLVFPEINGVGKIHYIYDIKF